MERPKIEIGFRVGRLTVTGATEQRKNGYIIWNCRCDCGGGRLLDTRTLQRGTVRDCGCETRVPPGAVDLTGRRYGRLIALAPTWRRGSGGGIVWYCQCDCGGKAYVPVGQLTGGSTKSCGCLGHPERKKLEGCRFGHLTVLSYAGKQGGMHRWCCRCDCGQETVVGQTLLQSEKTRSCGCRQAVTYQENLKLIDGTSVTVLERIKRGPSRANTSGYTGVFREKRSGLWRARITFKGKTYHLGVYRTMEEAVQARKRGEELHDAFLAWYHGEHTGEA